MKKSLLRSIAESVMPAAAAQPAAPEVDSSPVEEPDEDEHDDSDAPNEPEETPPETAGERIARGMANPNIVNAAGLRNGMTDEEIAAKINAAMSAAGM